MKAASKPRGFSAFSSAVALAAFLLTASIKNIKNIFLIYFGKIYILTLLLMASIRKDIEC
jgi:hypothetical protein